jgi:uroporphyrinogen decarboxylase
MLAVMNKRDLMLGLLDASRKPETVPAAFFLHFDKAFHRGQAAVDKHLEYFRHTGMDLVKIQFEHPMPHVEMKTAADWRRMPHYGLDFYEAPLKVVEGLVKAAKREAIVVLTLYSPFMLARQTAGEDVVARHIAEDPEAFKAGIGIITEGLLAFCRQCLKLGLDGFYASTQGGEAGRFADPRAFDQCVRPFDMMIMNEINAKGTFNILHVCDYHYPYADLAPFTGYPGHVVNTSLELTGGKHTTAREVARLYNRPFMGGLERKGVIARGTPAEIKAAVIKAIHEAPERFVLGADCTVPPETPWDNIKLAIQTAHEVHR